MLFLLPPSYMETSLTSTDLEGLKLNGIVPHTLPAFNGKNSVLFALRAYWRQTLGDFKGTTTELRDHLAPHSPVELPSSGPMFGRLLNRAAIILKKEGIYVSHHRPLENGKQVHYIVISTNPKSLPERRGTRKGTIRGPYKKRKSAPLITDENKAYMLPKSSPLIQKLNLCASVLSSNLLPEDKEKIVTLIMQ